MGIYDGERNQISDDALIRFRYNDQAGVETDENGLYYMRARYYNTDIKRFLNRDILDGTIDNGQSLNKYSYVQGNPVTLTDPFGLCPVGSSMNEYLVMLGHTVLELLGFVPVVGFVADLANAYWYYREGNTFQMVASIIAAIPGAGDAAGSIIKGAGMIAKCEQAVKVGKAVSVTCRMLGAIAQTGVNIINFDRAFGSVRKEYRETGHVSFLNGANAVLSALGVVGGVAQSVNSVKNFNKMRSSLKSNGYGLSNDRIKYYLNNSINNTDSNTAILGSTGSYDVIGEAKGYTYFKMEDAIWSQLEIESSKNYDEIWKINKQFIDEQVAAGKRILLSNNPNKGYYFNNGKKRFYQRELDYLKELGYSFESFGDNLWEAISIK